jgi:hypothetical protein
MLEPERSDSAPNHQFDPINSFLPYPTQCIGYSEEELQAEAMIAEGSPPMPAD